MDFKVTSDYILYLHDYYPVRSEKPAERQAADGIDVSGKESVLKNLEHSKDKPRGHKTSAKTTKHKEEIR